MHQHTDSQTGYVADSVTFRALRQFNDPRFKAHARSDYRLNEGGIKLFPSDGFTDRIARALATAGAIRLKEVLESFEFFERTRRTIRGQTVVDLCCGHGLVGMLFAVLERQVESVILVDKCKPKQHEALLRALCSVAPWAEAKIRYVEAKINRAAPLLPQGASVVGVHACGIRTDYCIQTAIELRGPVAVLPCCYGQTGSEAPLALRRSLGVVTATDVHRTYVLERAGYEVRWGALPAEITPMNRIIQGRLKPMTH